MGAGKAVDEKMLNDRFDPYLEDNILTMTQDLTDNDLVLRQINAAHIIKRMLRLRLSNPDPSTQQAKQTKVLSLLNYYGDSEYWLRSNIPMKIILCLFLLLCFTQKLLVELALAINKLLP